MTETRGRAEKLTPAPPPKHGLPPPGAEGAAGGAERLGAPSSRGGGPLGFARGHSPDAWRYIGYCFGTGLAFGFLQVLLGLYLIALGYGESFLATQQLTVALCSALSSVAAGLVVDRAGARRALLLSAGLTVVGLATLVADASPALILGASVVTGTGIGFYWVSQGSVLAEVSPPGDRARLYGLTWALFTASGFFGGVLGGSLPGWLGGPLALRPDSPEAYRLTVWVGVLGLGLLSLPLVALRLRVPAHGESRGADGPWWRVERPRVVAALLIPVAASAAAIGLTIPFLSVFFTRTYGASTASAGLVLGVFALAGSVGSALGPALRTRFGPVWAVAGLLVISAPAMLLTGYAPGLAAGAAALWTRGLLANAAWPVALAYLIESVGERERGRVSALMNISFELSLAATTLPAGLLMERVSYRLPYALAAGLLIAGGLGYAWALRGDRRPAIQSPRGADGRK